MKRNGSARRRGQRATKRLGPALVALCLALVTVAATAPTAKGQVKGPMQTSPAATVSPSAGLADGDMVTVAVSGFEAHTWVTALQCPSGAGWQDCAPGSWFGLETDGSGQAELEIRVSARFTSNGETGPSATDCRVPEACQILVISDDTAMQARAPLSFAADAPLIPAPEAAVVPTEGLVAGQTVEITGTGFTWSEWVDVYQCRAPVMSFQDCDSSTQDTFEVSPDGTFQAEHSVVALVDLASGGSVDCREAAERCALVMTPAGSGFEARKRADVPLTFDPDREPGTRVDLLVDPATDLVDGQVVEVSASGLTPDAWLELYQCPASIASWSCTWIGGGLIDSDGGLRTQVAVVAVLDDETDCRTAPEPCQLVGAINGRLSPSRSPRDGLHFAADGELQPPPTIDVTPSAELAEGEQVTVTGDGFRPQESVSIELCTSGGPDRVCADDVHTSAETDETGAFTVQLTVYASIRTWDGELLDCRAAVSCVIAATQYTPRNISAAAPVTFGPAPPSRGRYLDPVFDQVEVERDIVYRTVEDHAGNQVDLALDIYQPAGDTAGKRPAIVWMHGGYFVFGDKSEIYGYGEDFARMGYVVVSVQYRLRPDMDLWPNVDLNEFLGAVLDGYDDAAAAVVWLEDHADEYRIDPDAIVAGGYSAGATNALNLAWLHNNAQFERTEIPGIAAATPVASAPLGSPGPDDVPVLQFHGDQDTTVEFESATTGCRSAPSVGGQCELVIYEGAGHEIISSQRRDIQHRITGFVAAEVLGPLGYDVDVPPRPSDPGPGPSPGDPGPRPDPGGPVPGGSTPAASSPASSANAGPTAARDGGDLPRTGNELVLPLMAAGLGLTVAGGALYLWSRRLSPSGSLGSDRPRHLAPGGHPAS